MKLPFLEPMPAVFLGVVLVAWLATFAGALRRAATPLAPAPRNPTES